MFLLTICEFGPSASGSHHNGTQQPQCVGTPSVNTTRGVGHWGGGSEVTPERGVTPEGAASRGVGHWGGGGEVTPEGEPLLRVPPQGAAHAST